MEFHSLKRNYFSFSQKGGCKALKKLEQISRRKQLKRHIQ